MQNRQTGRRRRGGGGGQPRPLNQPMGSQAGNRLENRVRGNASQLLEKYKQLARDAHQSGDRVAAEYYLQHAEHYFRVLNDARIRHEEMRVRRGVFDPIEDDVDDEPEADGADRAAPSVVQEANGHVASAEAPAGRVEADEPAPLSDGEAALIAFGGAPLAADRDDGGNPVPPAEDEPARQPRRRGRPRKTPAPSVEA